MQLNFLLFIVRIEGFAKYCVLLCLFDHSFLRVFWGLRSFTSSHQNSYFFDRESAEFPECRDLSWQLSEAHQSLGDAASLKVPCHFLCQFCPRNPLPGCEWPGHCCKSVLGATNCIFVLVDDSFRCRSPHRRYRYDCQTTLWWPTFSELS